MVQKPALIVESPSSPDRCFYLSNGHAIAAFARDSEGALLQIASIDHYQGRLQEAARLPISDQPPIFSLHIHISKYS